MSASRPAVSFVLAVGTLLLVLGTIPRVVEPDQLAWIVPLDAFFRSSAVGGALALAALGHLTCSDLLNSRAQGRLAVVYTFVTWVVPLWVLQLAVVMAAAVTRRVDTLAPTATSISEGVWAAALTFRSNLWVSDHMLEVPREVLGLTLVSIAVQLTALLAVAVLLVPRRWSSTVLTAAAAVAALVVVALRWRAVEFQDPFLLSLDTFARSDAFFVGVFVACASRGGWRLGPSWSSGAALIVLGTVLAADFVSTEQLLAVLLPAAALLSGLIMLDDSSDSGDWVLQPVLRSGEVAAIATAWAALATVAPLAAAVVGRRTEMNSILRVIVLLIVLAIVLRASHSAAARIRIPERTFRIAGWRGTWRRVVAEADADIMSRRGGGHARDSQDDDRPPAD